MGKQWKQCQTLFFWAPKSLQMVTAAMKLKDAYSLEGKLQSIFKNTYDFANKGLSAAKSLQSCLTLCDPRDGSPPGSPIPGILQARTLEWVAISFSNAWKWKVKSLSHVQLLGTPWTAAYQAPPSMGFSRQEYWSGVPLPSPKVFLAKAMVFPVVMYGCESWTVKKAECWRIDAFELLEKCWRRLLRVPWTARRSNQSILKEISPGCSLEGLMLRLKLQYFGHLMWRVNSLEKTLMLGGIGGRRRREWQRMRWLALPTRCTWVWVNSGSWWWTGRPGVLRFMGCKELDTTERLNWTELNDSL